MIKTNFHTHTFYCDGKDSPKSMVEKAIEKGFEIIGFSGHSYTDMDKDFAMGEEKLKKYTDDILSLKEEYKDKIKIYLGLEQDYFSEKPKYNFDYLIGSVHYILKDGNMLPIDLSVEAERENVDKFYKGDFDLYARDYFETVADVINKTNADIIGHFDLVSKYVEKTGYVETTNYLSYAENAIKKLVRENRVFEVNTGAIARGYKTFPYPSYNILKIIKKYGGKVMITSDCHDRDFLDCYFYEAFKLIKEVGFTDTKDNIVYY